MNDKDKTDLWTAFAVGAVVGVGAALLLRAAEEPPSRGLRPAQQQARRAVRKASRQVEHGTRALGRRGEDLLDRGSAALAELRREAARIVDQTRRELEDVAQSSVKHARGTVRRARRRFA